MNARRLVLGVCLIATASTSVAAQDKRNPPHEQTDFSAEAEGVDHPVPLPADVLKALGADEMVREEMQNSDSPVQTPPSGWFSASKAHLAGPEEDLVVLAEAQLRGANFIAFWVFRKTPSGYELVLNAPAHDLGIRNHRSNGYRDIEMVAMTSQDIHTVLYRFDGKRYGVYREKTEPIK